VPLVLVVDDSITVRRVTQRLLAREGYRVALAADGLQALERLAEELPAVVLSDIEMPRMDGFDLARNIRGDAHLKHLPIVMITSRIAEKHRSMRRAGVNHYLGKPYSEEELLRGLVKNSTRRSSRRRRSLLTLTAVRAGARQGRGGRIADHCIAAQRLLPRLRVVHDRPRIVPVQRESAAARSTGLAVRARGAAPAAARRAAAASAR